MSTHKELATANTFNEKFKRALLDYYAYGFKSIPADGTLANDWNRLNNIIKDYVTWSSNRRKSAFASADSRSMETNPFHRVYRFCGSEKTTDPVYFLHSLAILSNAFTLRGYNTEVDIDRLLKSDELNDAARERIRNHFYDGEPLKTSDITFLYAEMISENIDKENRVRTPFNKLTALNRLGIVDTDRIMANGNHGWGLSPLTAGKIINECSKYNRAFSARFQSMVDFYSRYHLFGEIGIYLIDRLNEEQSSPFRFKHDYFTQSLNDFNAVDLLTAIENNKWCGVSYKHGTTGVKTELLCFPIELRISYSNGREYLIHYEPFKRSATALRLDFIDSITYYSDDVVKQALVSAKYATNDTSVEKDIANAREMLRYTWGVSISKQQINNAVGVASPQNVSLRIAYNGATEYYIENRMNRERRFGSIEFDDKTGSIVFSALVSDPQEMLPWVRSFYSRITECDGFESSYSFSIEADVERALLVCTSGDTAEWGIPERIKPSIGAGAKSQAHELLFNEIFSTYYYVLSDVFVCVSSNDNDYTEKEIKSLINRSLKKYSDRVGTNTGIILPKRIMEILLDSGLLLKSNKANVTTYQSRYCCSANTDFYRDIVPLSYIEVRWLKTIVNDEKAGYFLGKEDLDCLKGLLNSSHPEIAPFDMSKAVYFDRHHYPKESSEHESKSFAVILDSIKRGITLATMYRTNKGETKNGEYKPIVLEFSKRDNRFQCILQSCKDASFLTVNVDSIMSITPTGNAFDRAEALNALWGYRNQNKRSIEIEFTNAHNVVDRILMEFAPWEKRCLFDEITGFYKLTIYYLGHDEEVAIVTRLMGYGSEIRFVDKEHWICREIIERLEKQKELFKGKVHLDFDKRTEIGER